MLHYVYGHDKAIADFVAQMIPHCRYGFGNCKTIGVIDAAGRTIAGIVFHNWNPQFGLIEITAAALPRSRWFMRETIRRMYGYPFDIAQAQMILHWVRADNTPLLRQLAAIGCTRTLVPRMFGRDMDAMLCTLTCEQWKANRINKRINRPMLEEAA